MRFISYLLGVLAALTIPSIGSATVYTQTGSAGTSGTYNLSVTTDNTIGVLSPGNILAWNILVSDATNSFTLTDTNSQVGMNGGDLSATATDLLFNFSDPGFYGYALFQSPTTGNNGPYFCWQASGCFDFNGGGTGLSPTNCCGSSDQITRLSGTQIVATAAAVGGVPEPASWAMMLLGFGAIGMALRRAARPHGATLRTT